MRFLFAAVALCSLSVSACEHNFGAESQSAVSTVNGLPAIPRGARLARLTRDQVCMANDQYMANAQPPIDVEGRTYFGCCATCKSRLERDANMRTAEDPVTRKPVDKANAVIGMLSSGDVLYFQNEHSFQVYNQS
jgi:YHS domain-containing protein